MAVLKGMMKVMLERERVAPGTVFDHKFIAEKYPDVVNDLEKGKELTDSVAQRLDKAVTEFKASFLKG